jgi:CBS domain-containing protein
MIVSKVEFAGLRSACGAGKRERSGSLTEGIPNANAAPVIVREIMNTNPVTVESTTPMLEAMELIHRSRVGGLPVVDDGQLVGIVTSYDFLDASLRLFREHLKASPAPETQRATVGSSTRTND